MKIKNRIDKFIMIIIVALISAMCLIVIANLLSDMSEKYNKPIVVSVNAGSKYFDFISIIEERGLPVYRDVRSALKSLDKFISYYNQN